MSSAADLSSGASAVLLILLLAGIAFTLAKRVDDPFGLFVLVFGVFYGFRAVLVGFGLDEPSPAYLFSATGWNALHSTTVWHFCAFLVAFWLTGYLTSRRSAPTGGVLFFPGAASSRMLVVLTALLTLTSCLVGAWLLARFGSVGGVTQASKLTNELAGFRFLKVPSSLGAIVGSAAFLDLRATRRAFGAAHALCLTCAVLNSILVFAWGQRTLVLIVLAMVVLNWRPSSSRPSLKSIARIAVAAVLVISAAVFLRDTRDDLIAPDAESSFGQQTFWRRASLGVNGVYFDASMLAFRDWPDRRELRGGEDFLNGLAGPVPRALWAEKPDPLPGKWFRNEYEPSARNGWPVGTPTIWFLNFGWLGLVIGGLLSGAAYGAFARRARAAPRNGINIAMTFVFAVLVFPMGLVSQAPLLMATWLAPMLAIVTVLRWNARRNTDHTKNRRSVTMAQ